MLHGDWLERRAASHGARVALVDLDGGTRLSYAQLDRRAAAAAGALAGLGVGPGDRVAILATNRLEHVELLFACARLGAVLVPLNWRLPGAELAPILVGADPAVLLVDAGSLSVAASLMRTARLPGVLLALDAPSLDAPVSDALAPVAVYPALRDAAAPVPSAPLHAETPWLLLYTSGSSGRPKGVVLTHGSITWNLVNTRVGWDLRGDDVTIAHTPFFHTGGWNVLALPLLHGGGTVLITKAFDPARTLQAIRAHGVTTLFAVPTMFADLLAELQRPVLEPRGSERTEPSTEPARAALRSLRFLVSGGAPCPLPLIEAYAAHGVLLKQGYGLTEVGPNCFLFPDGEELRRAGSVGLPMPHLGLRLVRDDGTEAGIDEPGELQLAGPTVCAGYWRDPDASAAALTPDGWFCTGDLLRRDKDGWYSVCGRKKEMFISGGENVYPAEVERVLYDLPGVFEAAVVPESDARWGEVGHAFLALRPGAPDLDAEQVRRWCRERLAGYKVPKRVTLLPSLPHGPTGKIARRELEDALRTGSSAGSIADPAPPAPAADLTS